MDRGGRKADRRHPAETLPLCPEEEPEPGYRGKRCSACHPGHQREPGEREIRLATPTGLSNPLRFWVGQLPEFSKREVRSRDRTGPISGVTSQDEPKAVPPTETTITLPAIVNGQILPGGVDRFRFPARKGLQLVVVAEARALIPYLADAVPGWFQAALALYDAKGKELEHADHFRFDPDPVLHYEIPKDGEYVVESGFHLPWPGGFRLSHDRWRGPYRNQHFPAGRPGRRPDHRRTHGLEPPGDQPHQTNGEPGVHLGRAQQEGIINRLPFAAKTLRNASKGAEQHLATAQPVTLPIIVNGRVDQPGDLDVFSFEGRAGDTVVAEVYARRLDSPLDSVLKLTDAAGKQLAFNDDHEDKGSGLDTHYADSYLTVTLPADGDYYIHLGDAQHQGGPEFAYRLRISPPRPDFALRVVPSSLDRPGRRICSPDRLRAAPGRFHQRNQSGFAGRATGVRLAGAKIPASQEQVRLTLTAPAVPTEEPLRLSLEGRAVIQGEPVVHAAIPAEDMMQAFAYRHLVPAQELDVAVSGRFMNRMPLKILSATPVRIPAGGAARVRVATPSDAFVDRFRLELSEPPEGISLGKVSAVSDGTEIELLSDAAKAKPGLKGNLIVNIMPGQALLAAKKNKKQGNQSRAAVGTLPAIPFEVVPAPKED